MMLHLYFLIFVTSIRYHFSIAFILSSPFQLGYFVTGFFLLHLKIFISVFAVL